jgi:hypothetical protein
MSAGFHIFIYLLISELFGSQDLDLLLIGHDLDIIGGGSGPESHGLPIAYVDVLHIDLDATVLAGGSIVNLVAASALPRILILLDH